MDEDINNEVLGQLKDIMGEKYPGLVDTYIENAQKYIKNIQSGIANDDLQAVINAAHPLMSSSGNMGLVKLSGIAGEVERTALEAQESGKSISDAGIAALVDDIDEVFSQAEEGLRA